MTNQLLLISDVTLESQKLMSAIQDHDLAIQLETLERFQKQSDTLAETFSIVILDIHHELKSFFLILEQLRRFIHLNLMVLSSSTLDKDCLEAFALGADDYLKKPIVEQECIARIKALLRRSHVSPIDNALLTQGAIHINCLTRQALHHGVSLTLTNAEFNLLELFLRYPGRVLSKEQLTEYSLGRKYTAYDRSIDVHISHLRQKLDDHDESCLKTIRGYGYTFISKG